MKKKSLLKFEYCECGCKGYSGGTGDNSFWIFWDLKEKFTLIAGHGCCGVKIDDFVSYQAAVKEATKLFKQNLKNANDCLG